jgi:hypothetical protein
MLLARSAEERLKMACSMGATARALVRASVLARDPHATPAAVRRQLFLRFYGNDFDAPERERILEWLSRNEPRSAELSRRVPVNWDDLEMALTTNRGEWTCYLDVRSGEVQRVPADWFGADGDWPSADEIDAAIDAGRLIRVDPLGAAVEHRWMSEFADAMDDVRLRDRLLLALDGRGAFRRFKNVLGAHAAERERWFAFRDERLRTAARKWLAERGIEPTTTSPDRRR